MLHINNATVPLAILITMVVSAVEFVPNNIIKGGFGVNFVHTGHVLPAGSLTYAQRTWVLEWPKFLYEPLPLLDCTRATDWQETCEAVNDMISATNQAVYESLSQARKEVNSAGLMMPFLHPELANETFNDRHDRIEGGETPPDRRRRRARRDTGDNDDDYHKMLNEMRQRATLEEDGTAPIIDDDLPGWLKSQPSDAISDYWPGNTAGQFVADLFHRPGPRTKRKLREHIREVGKGIYYNQKAIAHFDSGIDAFSVHDNQQVDFMMDTMNKMRTRLNSIIAAVKNEYKRERDAELTMRNRIAHVDQISAMVDTKIVPMLTDARLTAHSANREARRWARGLNTLANGILSPALVRPDMIRAMLDELTTEKDKDPKFRKYTYLSAKPLFYYKYGRVAYTRDERNMYVTLSVPMMETGATGLLDLYRVDVYPVPVTAGTRAQIAAAKTGQWKDAGGGDKRLTRLSNMASYFTVSKNRQMYLELDTAKMSSCRNLAQIFMCPETGMPALTKAVSYKSCTYAVFTDDMTAVQERCDPAYEHRGMGFGSAVQIGELATFMMHAGNDERHWRMSCTAQEQVGAANSVRSGRLMPPKTDQVLEACSMCRVTVPCMCSLTGDQFYLPARLTHCLRDDRAQELNVQFTYHLNTLAVKTLWPERFDDRMKAYEIKLDTMYKPFPPVNLTFTTPASAWDNAVALSHTYLTNYTKLVNNLRKGATTYETKFDAAYNRTVDFSDQVVDKAGSLSKAVKDVVEGVFGNSPLAFLAVLFTPVGLALVSLGIALVIALPVFIKKFMDVVRVRKSKDQYTLLMEMYS